MSRRPFRPRPHQRSKTKVSAHKLTHVPQVTARDAPSAPSGTTSHWTGQHGRAALVDHEELSRKVARRWLGMPRRWKRGPAAERRKFAFGGELTVASPEDGRFTRAGRLVLRRPGSWLRRLRSLLGRAGWVR